MAGSSSFAGPVFQWGNKEAGLDSSYESMYYKGVWFNLHDCVFCKPPKAVRDKAKLPYVGKLMRLYEEGGKRKVRIRWFFRPYELPVSVKKDLPEGVDDTKELFIALGEVAGVENKNAVEVILGKATVLCTARHPKNPMPSPQHLDVADHFFRRVYDASRKRLLSINDSHLKKKKFLGKSHTLCIFLVEYYGESRFSTETHGNSQTH